MRSSLALVSKLILGAALMVLVSAAPASAVVYEFSCITVNDPTDCGILEAQLWLEVTSGDGIVNFRFTNNGPEDASITDVYFSDLLPPLLGTPSIITSSSGVSFSSTCSPGSLPGGGSGFTTSYCADSNSPVQPNGVNPGEWLNISYTLQDGATFADVIAAIEAGDYRIGIHVQGFDGGGSEAGVASVPEPSSLVLVTTGLGLVPLIARRRRKY